MTLNECKDLFSIIGTIATVAAVGSAAFVYWRNSRLERAKWLASLYEKFYEKEHLKAIREILDCKDEISLDITKIIRDESAEFTDYLNFFEFVAFLKTSKQLKYEEVEQLFGYYLNCLNRRQNVKEYIKSKDYELLSALLEEFATERKKIAEKIK